MSDFPTVLGTVLDTTDARGLAEFYRHWLVLAGDGGVRLEFQQVDVLPRSTWPEDGVP